MRKFIKNILLFGAIFFSTVVAMITFDFFVIGNQYSQNYQASIIDKVNRLTSIDEPKIILIGNSNLAFGIDSELIEKEVGMPVVNLGLHGSMGDGFHEKIAKLNINKGDIVILCHTDFSGDGKIDDIGLAWITLEKNIKLYKILSVKDYIHICPAYPRYFLKCLSLWKNKQGNIANNNSYSRTAFNQYGDIIVRPKKARKDVNSFFSKGVLPPDISTECINRINKYSDYVTSQGATLLIAGYPIGYGKYTGNAKDFTAFQKKLEELVNCDVISNYTDYFIPYDLFYDTRYHLTEEGAKIRTEQLISDIKRWEGE